jgi:hypothetical protein
MTSSSVHAPQPRESAWRCALRAQLRGDAMLGTAFPASRVLLVEQPGPWGHAGLADSRFDRTVAEALAGRVRDAGLRLQVIRRPGRTPAGALRRWMIADCRSGHEQLVAGTFVDDAELLSVPLDGSAGVLDAAPLFLVCAHSKHDACCALRGRNVAAALEVSAPGRVFECSHLGGDRFAANVLVLPAGLLYGRVLPFAAPEFVAAASADEVVGALLRGRIGLPPAAQAALAFGYEHLALRSRSALAVVSTGAVVDGRVDVVLAGPHGELVVTVSVERTAADGLTCANPAPSHYLAYRPIAIRSVE